MLGFVRYASGAFRCVAELAWLAPLSVFLLHVKPLGWVSGLLVHQLQRLRNRRKQAEPERACEHRVPGRC